jgi:hypothetical protein
MPQSWNPLGTDDSIVKMMEEIAAEFFSGKGAYRGTGHVVSLKFYFNLTLDISDKTVAILQMKEIDNPAHRHQSGVDWSVFSDMKGLPDHWIDLTKIAA